MKRTTTKTEIIVETRQRVTVRGSVRRTVACPRCGAEVPLLPDGLPTSAPTTAPAILQCVEAGELHSVETDEGALLIRRETIE